MISTRVFSLGFQKLDFGLGKNVLLASRNDSLYWYHLYKEKKPQHKLKGLSHFISTGNIDSYCQANPMVVKENPSNCAQYYNCSDNSSKYGHHLEECPYPDLFSTMTLSCQKFESVDCKNKTEPEAPCLYNCCLCTLSDIFKGKV